MQIKNYKIQVILALISFVLTFGLMKYEYKHDNGPGSDPFDIILICGAIYSLIFYGMLNLLFLASRPLLNKIQNSK